MRNKRVTITSANLNTGVVQVIIPEMTLTFYDKTGVESETKIIRPTQIQIINDTGSLVSFNNILTEQEYSDYEDDATQFAFQRVPNTAIVQSDLGNFASSYKFLIKGEGVATSNLIVEFINYR